MVQKLLATSSSSEFTRRDAVILVCSALFDAPTTNVTVPTATRSLTDRLGQRDNLQWLLLVGKGA